MSKLNQKGVVHTFPLLVIVAVVGLISFLLISSTAPFKGGNLNNLFPKKSSFASVALPSGKLTRYGSNPIVPIGPDAYDKYKTGPRVVLKMGPTDYRMWYEAVFGSNATYTAYATSTDGLTWTKQGPIIYPTENWEGGAGGEISPNTILIENGVYKLWYHSYKQSDNHRRIGYATSTDGLTWTKYPNNPILDVGPPGSFDENQIAEPRVFNLSAMGLGTGYRMYYGGLNAGNSWSYGIATSPDGLSWTKNPSNPIFDPGGDTGEGIIYDNGMWHMWYGISYAQGLAYASSPDGLSWTNGPSNPVLTINPDKTQWDNTFVGDSVSVYKDNNTYRIMYTGIHTAIGPIMAPEAISLATIAVPTNPSPTPTPRPTPTPPGNDLSFVSGITTLGGLRNDYGNFVGTQIHIGGSNLTVTQLGRYFVNGNNQTHTVELVRVSDKAVVASSNLNMAQGVTDNLGFKYGVLSPFVTLTANTDYYLVTQEMSGGDQWEDSPPSPTVTHTNVASIPNSIWFDGNWNTQVPVDSTYGPVNFKYLPPVSTPSPTPTSTSTPTPRPTSTPTIVPTPTPIPTPTPNSCPKGSLGDIDCNGKIDIFDYNTLVGNFGKSGVGPSGGDIDLNGKVDIFDYNILVTNFGK